MSSTMNGIDMLLEAAHLDAAMTLLEFSKQATETDRLDGIIRQVHYEWVVCGKAPKPSATEAELESDNPKKTKVPEHSAIEAELDSDKPKPTKAPERSVTKVELVSDKPEKTNAPERSVTKVELGSDKPEKTNAPERSVTEVKLDSDKPKQTKAPKRSAAEAGLDSEDKSKKTLNPRVKRNKGNTKGRSTIEQYGLALNAVVKKHDNEIPNYSASFSDPKESEIAQKVFAKDRATASNKKREKYEDVKRRCLFAAALLYEANLLRVERGDRPFDINTTRMQPAGLVDVNCIRPIFCAYRPANDTTFKGKVDKLGNDPEEDIKGLLAQRNWFPTMLEKKGTKYELVNTDWYENLGTKQERQKWLAIVEEKKAQLIEKAQAVKETEGAKEA